MPKRGSVFSKVGSLHPSRSVFDLSYADKFSCDFGQLIPVCFSEVVPGDTFKISNEIVIRFQPLVHPIMHEINVYAHYFFVPTRLIWEDWEKFITGGEDGNDNTPLPLWDDNSNVKYSLWDYFGISLNWGGGSFRPIDFPKRCYNLVYNEYYRDENLIEEVDLLNNNVLNRAWTKDYFTASLPFQQRGIAPALPISGNAHAVFGNEAGGANGTRYVQIGNASNPVVPAYAVSVNATDGLIRRQDGNSINGNQPLQVLNLDQNHIDVSQLATFDISDLRYAIQVQKWLERNARAGVRYTEFLQAHHGVSPSDQRLQRPEYIGGSKAPVIISEVLQTSSTDTESPQGNLAGHGISADRTNIGTYHAQEYGYIIGIMSVMPHPSYQQGIHRSLLRRTKYDFYFREFANLSERAIVNAEIFSTPNDDYNAQAFGFIGQYDELRVNHDIVCADMRDDFITWHLGRIFDPNSPPALNQSFIECDSQTGGAENPLKRVFAVPSQRGLIVNYANRITAIRPMPSIPEPGLIDHF